jgi:hypothetical protein
MQEIGNMFGVTSTSIKYWMNKMGIEHRSVKKDVLFEPCPTLCYLFGVLHGDGFLYHNPANKQNLIMMKVKDYNFAQSFARALTIVGLNPMWIKNSKPYYEIRAISVNFFKMWKDMTIEERMDFGFTYDRDFIRGFYESDGCMKEHRGTLELSMDKPNQPLILRIKKVLEEYGYNPKTYERLNINNTKMYNLSLFRSLEIRRFIAWINPSIKYLPRKYANTEPSQNGDILEGVESTKAQTLCEQVDSLQVIEDE